ncbi:MAG: hypothetical protein GY754_37850 [bacterium]|nr:hypothetical protein [bacterium]
MPVPTLGELLRQDNVITEDELEEALDKQKKKRRKETPIGVILIRFGYISTDTFLKYLTIQTDLIINRRPEKPIPLLGDLLLNDKVITRAQLNEALSKQYNDGGRPIGILLMQMGIIDQETLMIYLAKQTEYAIAENKL